MEELDTLEAFLRALAPQSPPLDGARLLYTREVGHGRALVTACLMVRTPEAVVPGTAVKVYVDARPTGEHDDDGTPIYHELTHNECLMALVAVAEREARAKVTALVRAFGMSEDFVAGVAHALEVA